MTEPSPHSMVIVEQLNRSQWHSCAPTGVGFGVGTWVHVVAHALVLGCLYGWSVESHDLDGNRLLLAHAESVKKEGAR
jgi:hypothetical protein